MLLFSTSRLIGFGSATRATRTAGRWLVRANALFAMANFA